MVKQLGQGQSNQKELTQEGANIKKENKSPRAKQRHSTASRVECFLVRVAAGPTRGQPSHQLCPGSTLTLRRVPVRRTPCSLSPGLVVEHPTAVREDPGSNLTAAGDVYHDSHCDIQPWARVVHPYCSV